MFLPAPNRPPYGCSLPSLTGFDGKEIDNFPSEAPPLPSAQQGRVSSSATGPCY
ncbi:hypothetical protein [[Eubacterium] cellulosolvens]